MPSNTREIRRRLRSVGNTKKITKAMELVSSAKMRRAAQAVTATRPYADRAWEMLINLARRTDTAVHPLLQERPEPKSIGVVLITTNRGLVGSFNTQIINAVADYVRQLKSTSATTTEMVLMGSKGRVIFHQHGHPVAAEFEKHETVARVADVQPMAKLVIDGFTAGAYDRVVVAYMDYLSTISQKPRIRQILPITWSAFHDGRMGLLDSEERLRIEREERADERAFEYLFEPSADAVVEYLFPRLVEMQIYRALLETNAAEQAARMMAMRNATDAAGDLIDDLTLSFNQARQAGITQDLSEISAGRAALES